MQPFDKLGLNNNFIQFSLPMCTYNQIKHRYAENIIYNP